MKVSSKFCVSLAFGLAVAGVLLLPVRPVSAAEVQVRIDGNGVPQFLFDSEPRLVSVPNTYTYYAQDVGTADVYRMNNTWYAYYGDAWYRADNYRGPWTRYNSDGIPQEVMQTPRGYYHFAHSNRGDNRTDRNDEASYRYSRNPDGTFSRDMNGTFARNPDGSYTRIRGERYMRNPDGSYSRSSGGGYFRNADGSYNATPDGNYGHNPSERYARNPDGTYNHSPDGVFYHNADGSYTRITDDQGDGRDGRNYDRDRRASMRGPDGSMIQIEDEPRMFPIHNSTISYARDYRDGDLYRYGPNWYINYNGNWYSANSYTGPWRYVETERVPSRIASVPLGYYRITSNRVTTTRTVHHTRRHRIRRQS